MRILLLKLILILSLFLLGGCYTILKVTGASKSDSEISQQRCKCYWHPCKEKHWCWRWEYYYCHPWWKERYWFGQGGRNYPTNEEPRPSVPKEKEQIERRRGLKSDTEKKKDEKTEQKQDETQDTLKTQPAEQRRGF